MNPSVILRPLKDTDLSQYTAMLHAAFNRWYRKKGWGRDYFSCPKEKVSVFYDIYADLTPGSSIAAWDASKEKLLGACFYHPRETHVALGIMAVHPESFHQGIGRLLVNHILDFTRKNDFNACRLVSSAMNMNSFSLYNRAGFVPQKVYHDMLIRVPSEDHPEQHIKRICNVRSATTKDIKGMGEIELTVSGIRREPDYRYAIENKRGCLDALVYENDQNGIDGFMISIKHPALNMLGPAAATNEKVAIALIAKALKRFKGESVLALIPVDKRALVEMMYVKGAKNTEIHLQAAWGKFPTIKGVIMPSFLPETG